MLLPSLTVTVIVEVALPSATTLLVGLATAVDSDAEMLPTSAMKPTVGVVVRTTWLGPGLTVTVMVFVSAVVDAIVPEAWPLASVVLPGCVTVLLEPSDARDTVCPETTLLLTSLTVIVIVEVADPSVAVRREVSLSSQKACGTLGRIGQIHPILAAPS